LSAAHATIDCQVGCDACRLLEADDHRRIQLHTAPDSLERLAPEWDRLLASSDADLFFPGSAWQILWWGHFGHEYLPRIVTFRDCCGRLIGIAPLMTSRADPDQTLLLIGGTEIADFLDLIVDASRADEARHILLEAVDAHLQWRTLDLHCLPVHSGTPAALDDVFASKGVAVRHEQEDVSPFVPLPGSWEGYLGSLNKKDRHELRRKFRRAVDDTHAEWRTVQSATDLAPTLDAFIALHRLSTAAKAEFMTEPMAGYFRDLAARTLEQGTLRMGVMWAGDVPMAGAMGFAYHDRFYLYNSGYDPAYAAHSVGIAAVGLLMRQAADEGLAIFDFLQGNETYKYMLGAQDAPVLRAVAERETR
jgi:CelD/BcsL family acetyltransferase involved in cellulose biosynthesis